MVLTFCTSVNGVICKRIFLVIYPHRFFLKSSHRLCQHNCYWQLFIVHVRKSTFSFLENNSHLLPYVLNCYLMKLVFLGVRGIWRSPVRESEKTDRWTGKTLTRLDSARFCSCQWPESCSQPLHCKQQFCRKFKWNKMWRDSIWAALQEWNDTTMLASAIRTPWPLRKPLMLA